MTTRWVINFVPMSIGGLEIRMESPPGGLKSSPVALQTARPHIFRRNFDWQSRVIITLVPDLG